MNQKQNSNPLLACSKVNQHNESCLLTKRFKKMIAFFRKSEPVATVALQDRKTVNANWYATIGLPSFSASSRTAHQIIDYLKESNTELLSHCPYSPDFIGKVHHFPCASQASMYEVVVRNICASDLITVVTHSSGFGARTFRHLKNF